MNIYYYLYIDYYNHYDNVYCNNLGTIVLGDEIWTMNHYWFLIFSVQTTSTLNPPGEPSFNEILINTVKQYRVLYCNQRRAYENVDRNLIWAEIANKIGRRCTGVMLKECVRWGKCGEILLDASIFGELAIYSQNCRKNRCWWIFKYECVEMNWFIKNQKYKFRFYRLCQFSPSFLYDMKTSSNGTLHLDRLRTLRQRATWE